MSKSKQIQKCNSLYERLRRYQPQTRRELTAYLKLFFNVTIPSRRVCPNHDSPLDYLDFVALPQHHRQPSSPTGRQDVVVWANRGGGKTHLGAIASLLDCLFLPRCDVRILGGSEEQSRRMYSYLTAHLQLFDSHLDGKVRAKGCTFRNRSTVQILAQSDRSVRGQHVQRLRCDEIELFDPDVWQGAQFITQSRHQIPARMEIMSTMHRPYGLMRDIVNNALVGHAKLFRWCLWEVIEPCRDRICSQCVLWQDCQGKAKNADGYFAIDDAIAQKRRSSKQAWQAEMLCQEPNREDVVFAEFSPSLHIQPISYNPNWPLYRTLDFGYSNPFACLFIQVNDDGNVFILDEYVKSRTLLSEHARLIKERHPYPVKATFCDPAGKQKREITGTSCVSELNALGIPTRSRPSSIAEGLDCIRRYLAPALGRPRLIINDQCHQLIRAFRELHYKRLPNGSLSELPDKDGINDHVIDALRYFFVNFNRSSHIKIHKY